MRKKAFSLMLIAAVLMTSLAATALAAGEEESCSVDLRVDGTGSVEAYLDGGWRELAHESGSCNLPIGEEVLFRCFSSDSELYSVTLNDTPVPFEKSEEDPDMWTFSFVPDDIWAELFLVFEADNAVDINVTVEGPGALYFYQDGEWTEQPPKENAFSIDTSDPYVLFRAAPTAEGTAALSITFDGKELPPSAYTPEGIEFRFSAPESSGTMALQFGLANLVTMPEEESVLFFVQKDDSWIPAEGGAPVPTGEAPLLCRLVPQQEMRISGLFLNGSSLELSPVEENGEMTYLFELPAQANGSLTLEEEAGEFLIEISPDAPAGLAITEDAQTGEILCGLDVGRAAVCDVFGWLSVPEYAVLQAESSAGGALPEDHPAATGIRIVADAGDGETLASVTLVVTGDVLGTGTLDIAQVVRLAQSLSGQDPLTGLYALAADLNGSGTPDIADLVLEAQMLTAPPAA